MPERPSKTIEELRKASVHIFYEWRMFNFCVSRLQRATDPPADIGLYNALLTAFGVHTRNLLDFFYPAESIKTDDMLAYDWFDEPNDWNSIRPELTEILVKTREMTNKLNAHLTYKRVTWDTEKKYWAWTQIHNDMLRIWNTFVANVSIRKLDPS